MDLNSLKLTLEVARAGGFAPVARAEGVDPSTVSRAVAQVEASLGVRLFERSTRRLALTEAGARYLQGLEPALEELAHAAEAARGDVERPSGALRLTASVAFWQRRIGPLLPRFRAAHPDLRVEALISDANVDLIAERIDLAIRLAPEPSGEGVATKLIDTRYRVCASPDYLVAAPPWARPEDIAAHDGLHFAHTPYRTRWRFRDAAGAVTEAPVRSACVLSSALALRDAALAGLGPALLADWLIEEDLAAGRLVDLFPAHDVTATSFETAAWAIYPSRAFLPAKTRAALDFLRAALRRAR